MTVASTTEKPQYKELRFQDKEGFQKWLEETRKYRIEFADQRQDFLIWHIDERGEVLHSEPFQSGVWNGKMVLTNTLKVGRKVFVYGFGFIKYKIIKTEKFK